jgi:hypothetical protein
MNKKAVPVANNTLNVKWAMYTIANALASASTRKKKHLLKDATRIVFAEIVYWN